MRIFRKEGNAVELIAFPEEHVEIGDYLVIEDRRLGRSLLVQVLDVQYTNIPGVFEDLLRNGIVDESLNGRDVDPLGVSSQIAVLKDTMLLACRIRGTGRKGAFIPWGSFLPSRNSSIIKQFQVESALFEKADHPIEIGNTNAAPLHISAKDLDGKLNIIAGRKGTGKSHLAKILMLGLIEHRAPCFVFDINGEYVGLGKRKNSEENAYADKLKILTPRQTLRFSLRSLGLTAVLNMLSHALELPWNSVRVFINIWNDLLQKGRLDLVSLRDAIQGYRCHETVRDAIASRYSTMLDSRLLTDNANEVTDLLDIIRSLKEGGAVIVNLKDQPAIHRRMVVELLLSKLWEFLYLKKVRAMFLFAEEAHLYLRETYWDDIVTRMRHIGFFATFITNQPDTIQESIYRQADNLFIFNFLNDKDLEMISRSAKIDSASVKQIVREIPPHHCLVLGDVVHNFPIVAETRDLDVETMGRTRFFFQD